jgi:ElaB/YqjD/DUF883 family membrane-anchored ribosome-binding protein
MIHIEHPNIPIAIRAAFAQKVIAIATYLNIDPNWLMQVMYAESKLNNKAQNIQKGRLIAAGLLQWTKASGTDPKSVLRLTHLQQLDKVQQYFAPYRGKMHSYFDVYMVTFFPMGMGKPDEYVFATKNLSAALIAKQNPIINKNKDGKITMYEFKQYVWNSTPEGVRGLVFKAQQMVQASKQKVQKSVQQVKQEIQEVKQVVVQKTKDGIEYVEEHPDTIGKAVGGIGALVAFFCFLTI